jgi:hypothetical protein
MNGGASGGRSVATVSVSGTSTDAYVHFDFGRHVLFDLRGEGGGVGGRTIPL